MTPRARLPILVAALALCGPASAADAIRCVDAEIPRARIESQHGRWVTVTTDQFNFLRGVYVLNPNTPAGMPPGDRAVLATVEGKGGALAFFIDGRLACTPMALPDALVKMLMEVDAGGVHAGVEQ